MRWSSLAVTMAALALAAAAPAPGPAPGPLPDPRADPAGDNTPEIIEIIAPAASAQETLSTLNLGAPGSELSERNKRTIGILRQLFPTLTQMIEKKVQQITSFVLQTVGPTVLRLFLGNRNGGGNSGGGVASGGGAGSVDLDDDDDDEPTTRASTAPEPLPSPASDGPGPEGPTSDDPASEGPASEGPTSEGPARRRRSISVLNGVLDENQLISAAESQQSEVRVAFGGEEQQAAGSEPQPAAVAADDQQAAANSASIDEISLDDGDDSEENRNKRFLSFGGGGSGGSSGGGSGNFLFDIVRRPAEALARAAGSAARLFSGAGGAGSLSLGVSASHSATAPLVAGGSSASGGEAAAGEEGEAAEAGKADGLTEGVPGPITRLFIIANRGIANLIQDLILRIAQTSERIVNFKARLITSII